MDKDLRDDTLKLVRYKVLFVKREYEHAFPEREDLVHDNMDGASFTAWKVAEFMQQLGRGETAVPRAWADKNYPGGEYARGGRLLGLREEDKKYLRVYYEVLERYPRQKFKYEQRQVRVLEQIRDNLSKKGGAGDVSKRAGASSAGAQQRLGLAADDPYAEMMNRLVVSRDTLAAWRQRFARCSRPLGRDIAAAFNKYRLVGHFPAPAITPEEVSNALRQVNQPFDRVSFDRFTGPALGDLRLYAPLPDKSEARELVAPPVKSVWGVTSEEGGRFIQRITGAGKGYVRPDDSPRMASFISEEAVDLTLNAYAEDLGVVSWVVFNQNHRNQLRCIGYELNEKLLWINQMLDPDMRPTLGPLPFGGTPDNPVVVRENQFILSIDWREVIDGKTCFCVYAMHIDFDFDRCRAVFAGRILKMLNRLVEL